MVNLIYRVYDIYCTGDAVFHSANKDTAYAFCKALNNKDNLSQYAVEKILLDVPEWAEDWDCVPEEKK